MRLRARRLAEPARYSLLITAWPSAMPPSLGGTRWCVCTSKPRDSESCGGTLRQIAVLKNSAAEHDLLRSGVAATSTIQFDQRIVEPRRDRRNGDSGSACRAINCRDQRTPVSTG